MIKNIDHDHVIHYGSNSVIVISQKNEFSKPFCQKILNEEYPAAEILRQLDNEFEFCSKASSSAVRKAFQRTTVENHQALVLEFIDGGNLKSLLDSGKISLDGCLHLAIEITTALCDIHKEDIFHKRINPFNILIEKATNKVYFIDLGLAAHTLSTDLVRQETNLDSLKYISPEQTGRIDRKVDNRADLYSLGVILYQIFTGTVPFESTDPLELVYAHLAKTPVAPQELLPEIPSVLSRIILKLLAKDAEDRYQSAYGIKQDLENCLKLLRDGRIEPFELGRFDYSGKFFLQQKLYGRELELDILFGKFKHCAQGEKLGLMVSGYSGSGKSALVTEVQKPVTDQKGIFIRGKFDQIKVDTPYAAFVQAFSELIRFFLAEDESRQQQWKEKIRDVLGNSGIVLTELIPGLETLIGKQPEVPELKGQEAQNRFNYEVTNFIRTVARTESPLVIFLDDLQWVDTSSLNLFTVIMEDREIRNLMIIGASRSNEVDESHPLKRKINELLQNHISLDEIELGDLSYDHVLNLLADTLRTRQENLGSLAEIIYHKTKGNAFYVQQFLKSIYEEGFLIFDFERHEWTWNKELILQMNVSGNVVDLMTNLVQKLPSDSVEILKTAACLGNHFDIRSLSVILQMREKDIESLLGLPMAEGLLIPMTGQYKFAHDRIQQAIYSLLPEKDRIRMHLTIGQRLSANSNEMELQEKIFDLVNQWNVGSELIVEEKTRSYLAHLNEMAGKKAVASAAYPQALQYFSKGLLLLGKEAWENQYTITLELTGEAAEAAYLCGEYARVEELVEELQQHSKTLVDSVKGYEISIKKLIAQNKSLDAVTLGVLILKKIGINLPLNPGKLMVLLDLLRTKWVLRGKQMDYFMALPEMTNQEMAAAMRICSDISSASFFAMPELVPLLVFKMVSMSVKYGLSRKSPFSFVAYGYILSTYFGETDKGIGFGQIALNLARKLKADELNAPILVTYNIFLSHWRKPFSETVDDLEKAFKDALESGDNEYGSYAAHNIVYQLFIMGSPLPALVYRSELLDQQMEKFKQDLTLKRLRIFRQSVLNLTEDSEHPDLMHTALVDESEMKLEETSTNRNNDIYFQNLYLQKLLLAIIFNLPENAYKYAEIAGRFQESVRGTALYSLFYFYQFLAVSGKYDGKKESLKRSHIRILLKCLGLYKKYAKLCPEIYSHKLWLMEAEYEQIRGNIAGAKVLYDQSLKAATEHHMVNDAAIGWERAGQFFLRSDQELVARFYLQNAYKAYRRWGAEAKLRQMMVYYPILQSSSKYDLQEEIHHVPKNQGSGDLDLATVMKASSALAGEIILPRLLRKLMEILLESAGAQRGFFIMDKGGERFIEAEIAVNMQEVKTLQSIPVSHSGLLAESIVNYVYMTREVVILHDASQNPLFSNDEFIKGHSTRSILCVPLMNQGKLQGIIYLDNDLTTGAFTEKRLALLKLLTGQIAISIENALFYSDLENKVELRTVELRQEKQKSDDLLLNILPDQIATELKLTGRTKPRSYEQVTVMFTDFKDFTLHSEHLSPEELVSRIDLCFRKFDEIISRFNLEKIKTIGDAYLCVSGLPNPEDHNPVNVVRAALEIVDFVISLKLKTNEAAPEYFDIRIGIHSGPLVAGVVGDRKFAYDIWGDTVNTAARMEQSSEANRINISSETYELVKDHFACSFRGKQSAKNKGLMDMYFVENAL
jgi:histidine kinase